MFEMKGKLSYIAVLAIATLLPCLLALRRPLRALPSCADKLAEFQKLRGGHVVPSSPSDAFIFFLHVPRTAGKTYATCFLRAAMPPTKRCAPSYDFLRYNTSQEGCRYITSHDDYSLTSQLPANTHVITQLRDPVTRVLSAYEFAIEVASRRINQNDEDVLGEAAKSTNVNTFNVWPWSRLLPWFRTDISGRLAALDEIANAEDSTRPGIWQRHWDDQDRRFYYWNPSTNESVWERPGVNATLDPYDNPLVMPLKEWLETPIAQELIHEGATLQLLGLTNYSRWPEAHALRRCFFTDPPTHQKLTALALERLDVSSHVGLTEELDDSVASLAAGLGLKLSEKGWKPVQRDAFVYDDPGFDPEEVRVTYNATRDNANGQLVELSVAEARLLAHQLGRETASISAKLRKLEPQLQDLVEKEETWLEEQKHEPEKAETAEAGAGGVFEAVKKGVEWIASMLPVKGQSNGGILAVNAALTNAGGGGGGAAAGDGSETRVDTKGAPSRVSAHRHSKPDEHDREYYDEDEDDGEGEAEQPRIESPWADEIEELDSKVYALQQQIDAIKNDIKSIRAIPEVKGPEEHKGRAKLIPPEEEYREKVFTLGAAYRRCSKNSSSRASDKRNQAFKHVRTPWDESFAFSSHARKALDPAIKARILELNRADAALWEAGKHLLQTASKEQKAAGTLETLPPKEESNKKSSKRPSGKRGGGRLNRKASKKGMEGKQDHNSDAASVDSVEDDELHAEL